jgi:hypothetical protein
MRINFWRHSWYVYKTEGVVRRGVVNGVMLMGGGEATTARLWRRLWQSPHNRREQCWGF